MKHLLFLLIAATFSLTVVAQQAKKTTSPKKEKKRQRINALIRQEEEGVIAYKKHFAVGGKLTTDGYGIFFEKGKGQSVKRSLLFQVEIAERKHNKEEKENKCGKECTFKPKIDRLEVKGESKNISNDKDCIKMVERLKNGREVKSLY